MSSTMSETRRAQLRALYEQLDLDKDGRVDIKELVEALKSRMPKNAQSVEYAQQMLKRADTSADAAIDFNEFLAYVTEHERKLALTFRDLDTNKDNVIDVGEVKKLFLELGMPAITDVQAAAIMDKMTSSGKNAISLDDFQRHFMFHPSATSEDIAKYWYRDVYVDIGESAVIVPGNPRTAWWKPLFVGGVAGAVSRTATAPLDRLKIFMQVHACHENKLGVLSSLKYLTKEGGLKALWRGNTVNVVKVIPDSAIKFWAYGQVKYLIAGDRRPNTVEKFCAGGCAGAISQTCVYPMEVLKTRFALRKSNEMNHGMIDAIRHVYRTEGIRAFTRGYAPTIIGIMPYAGIEMAAYETLKNLCSEHLYKKGEPGVFALLGCGCTSSILAQLASYPLALVRTRMQASTRDQPSTMRAQFTHIVRQEGFFGLYRGLVANFLKAVPAAALGYTVYESVSKRIP